MLYVKFGRLLDTSKENGSILLPIWAPFAAVRAQDHAATMDEFHTQHSGHLMLSII